MRRAGGTRTSWRGYGYTTGAAAGAGGAGGAGAGGASRGSGAGCSAAAWRSSQWSASTWSCFSRAGPRLKCAGLWRGAVFRVEKGESRGVGGSTRCRAVVARGRFVGGVGVAGRRWLVAGSWALGAGRWPHVNVNDGAPATAWVRGRDRGTVSGERGMDCSKWDCGSSCPAAGAGAESESAASSSAWVGRLRQSALVRPSGGCAAWAVVGVRSAMGVAQDGVHWGSGPVATVLLSAKRAFGQQSRVTGGLSSLFDYGGPEFRGKNTARAERHVKGGARWFPGPNSSRGRRRAAGKGPNPWPRVVCVCGYATLRCAASAAAVVVRVSCWLLAAGCVRAVCVAGRPCLAQGPGKTEPDFRPGRGVGGGASR